MTKTFLLPLLLLGWLILNSSCFPSHPYIQTNGTSSIDLSGSGQLSFPSNISKDVTQLSLMNNKIQNLSNTNLKDLHQLIYLNLRGNRFEYSYDLLGIEDATNLQVLDLSNNQLRTINLEIFRRNKNLNKLIINNNVGILLSGNLPNSFLEELSLRNGGLTELSLDLSGTPNLTIVDCRENPITYVSTNTTDSLPPGVTLKFDKCPIVIDREVLKNKNVTLICEESIEDSVTDISKTTLPDNDDSNIAVRIVIIIIGLFCIAIVTYVCCKKKTTIRVFFQRFGKNKDENAQLPEDNMHPPLLNSNDQV